MDTGIQVHAVVQENSGSSSGLVTLLDLCLVVVRIMSGTLHVAYVVGRMARTVMNARGMWPLHWRGVATGRRAGPKGMRAG